MTINDKTKQAMASTSISKATTPMDSMLTLLAKDTMKQQFAMALPAHLQKNADRYIRSFMTQLRQVPKLLDCSQNSLLGAMLTGTALGLDPTPSLGEFYILPYGREATFQLGYKGMLALAYRGGVKKIWAHEVCENDEFELAWGADEHLMHKPCLDNERGRGAVIGYYAAAILPNGTTTFFYMTKTEVLEHAKRFSPSWNRGPWQTDFDEMAKKTCAKQLFKWLPKSTEMAHAIERDESIVKAEPSRVVHNVDDVLDMEVSTVDVVSTETEEAPTGTDTQA